MPFTPVLRATTGKPQLFLDAGGIDAAFGTFEKIQFDCLLQVTRPNGLTDRLSEAAFERNDQIRHKCDRTAAAVNDL